MSKTIYQGHSRSLDRPQVLQKQNNTRHVCSITVTTPPGRGAGLCSCLHHLLPLLASLAYLQVLPAVLKYNKHTPALPVSTFVDHSSLVPYFTQVSA